MFPIELNQGGNYLIIRLCLTRPEMGRPGEGGEEWKEAGGKKDKQHNRGSKSCILGNGS